MAISYSGCTCGAGGGGGGECECPPTCVTTTCVLRCDDTTGDGLPDTTYSELWCIEQDGTSQLVLTYQGDPSEPYTPISPVDCEHGTMQCHTEMLCDDSGRPFLRKFTFLSNGTAAYVDVEIDGETPHVVIGQVRSCDGGSDCLEQRAPLATLGLCLADGTPIAVLVTRDCDGVIRQEGWLNLATGAYSAGQPPTGVTACGTPRNISTTGTFCDTDPATGDVLGLVLVQYTYNPDGSVGGVQLVDATTGQPYTPQGEITTCPTGIDQPEQDLAVLCEVAADGTVTPFLRDYRRNETGAIVGHSDYTLDGAAYVPTGTITSCDAQPCRDTTAVVLCDTTLTATPIPLTISDATIQDVGLTTPFATLPGSFADLWAGGPFTFPADADASAGDGSQVYRVAVGRITGQPCEGGEGSLSVSMRVTLNGPTDGIAYVGRMGIYRGTTGLLGEGVLSNPPVGYQQTLNAIAPITAADLTSGDLYVILILETHHLGPKAWTVDQVDIGATLDGCAVQFLRTIVTDCETGQVTEITDTTLDGAPYTVGGDVRQCVPGSGTGSPPVPPQPCTTTNVLRVCRCDDTDGDGVADTDYVALLAVDCDGLISPLGDYLPDLSAAYAPVSPVDCDADGDAPPAEPCDTAVMTLCDTAIDGTVTPFLRRVAFTCTGAVLDVTDLALDGVTPYTPAGTVGLCPASSTPAGSSIIRAERCDDTDGDGTADTCYAELLLADTSGTLTPLGTYTPDLSAPYTPIAPIPCDADTNTGDAEPAVVVQARRVQLDPGETWDADAWPLLRTVEATARTGTGQVTTADGTSTLHDGETARWAISKDIDARLVGPLRIAAQTGTVTINFTTGVTT